MLGFRNILRMYERDCRMSGEMTAKENFCKGSSIYHVLNG